MEQVGGWFKLLAWIRVIGVDGGRRMTSTGSSTGAVYRFRGLDCSKLLESISALTLTETSIPRSSSAPPQYVPKSGIACSGVRAIPTRIRSRFPTIPFVGSNSTQPEYVDLAPSMR